MSFSFHPRWIILGFFALFSFIIQAQNTNILVEGWVRDSSTHEPLSFVSIALKGQNIGTRTEDDGSFEFQIPTSDQEIQYLQVSSIGYETQTLEVPKGEMKAYFEIDLASSNATLQEVVIEEKKYRNKNNPAVDLIRLVVANRDKNRVENFSSYKVEQYEKVLMGLSNVSEKLMNKRVLRSWKFALENIDTTKLAGVGVTPIYLQESLQDFYSKTDPDRSKILVNTRKKVRFPLFDEDGIERYIRHLYQESDIYDNNITIVTNQFLSPIANNAWAFYRYYPADTIEEAGSKIVRLQFFPRNKMDMLLQGNLYIALDSTYPVTRIDFTVNPKINLNWVREMQVEQTFQKLPDSGKWVLAEESYLMDFGVFSKGAGLFGERYVSHKAPELGIEIADSLFINRYERTTVLANAEEDADRRLELGRHIGLNAVEELTYKNIDSLQETRLFNNLQKTLYGITVGFWKPWPGIEVGRINTLYSFNAVEGTRWRAGGRTNPMFSKRINLEAYTAYGVRDKRWKMGAAMNIAMSKRPYNSYPYSLLRLSYISDLTTPGVLIIGSFAPTSIATSFTRGSNDRFFFQKRFFSQYEKEYRSGLSFKVGFEHLGLEPLGSLSFQPTSDDQVIPKQVVSAMPFVQLRFAPGEKFYETQNGWRQRISFNFIGMLRYARGVPNIMGSQYSYDQWTAEIYKFSKTSFLGRNYFFVESGYIKGKVPYPFLTVHRGNQTFGYRFLAYNLMNFMEFESDQYVAMHVEQNFYGFFLNKIPLIRRLKFREFVTFKAIYGRISDINQPSQGSGLYKLPTYADGTPLTHSLNEKPYMEASVGLGNIFKIFRVDLVRRLSYLDHRDVNKYGLRVTGSISF